MRTEMQRAGFSYLEIQVALILLAIGVGGLTPLAVVQLKQTQQAEARLDPDLNHYIIPSDHYWAKKLGAVAAVDTTPPSPRPAQAVLEIDNSDPGYSETVINPGHWNTHASTNANKGTYREVDTHSVGNQAIFEFTNLRPGVYEVLVTYVEDVDYATNSPFRVYDGATLLADVRINQETPPANSDWDSLGAVSLQGDTLRVVLDDDADDDVVADSVKIVPIRNTLQVTGVTKTVASDSVSVDVAVTVVVN